MFYRVDYVMALLLAGMVSGYFAGRPLRGVPDSRVARFYLITIVVLVGVRAGLFAWSTAGHPPHVVGIAAAMIGDFGSLLFGGLLGAALCRADPRALLTQAETVKALCLATGFSFILAGLGKAFAMAPMTEFFNQSGYPIAFLRFIIVAEVFSGLGMLVPWLCVPTMAWLTVDMFGAVLTHVHNGDPLNDSTGAIASLLRLFILATLWFLRPEGKQVRSARRVSGGVAAAAVLCMMVAMAGGVAMRRQVHAKAESAAGGGAKQVAEPAVPLRRNAITLQDRL